MKRLAIVAAMLLITTGAHAQPAGWPPYLRWDLVPKWITWNPPTPTINWPKDDGCAGNPVTIVLEKGRLIDRFGAQSGRFFAPRGESFASRAMPYVCKQEDYRVYSVEKPVKMSECKAAAWFDEPGGAEQFETVPPAPDKTAPTAEDLVKDGVLKVVKFDPAGSNEPSPQCRGS